MLTNYNIWKYCTKYFFVLTISAYIFSIASMLMNQKDNTSNLLGSALFAGLLIALVVTLKSDVTKLVLNIKNLNKKNDE
mgnify:CR=1 FL=1